MGRACADDDAIRSQAVTAAASLEKLGLETTRGARTPRDAQDGGMPAHLVGGADRHCALVDHQPCRFPSGALWCRHRQYVLQIG